MKVICAECKKEFDAKPSEVKRGRKCCNKSCAAKRSNRKTGKYRRYLASQENGHDNEMDCEEIGWDAHKSWVK